MPLPGSIQSKRDAAGKARQIALALANDDDSNRLLTFAAELDAQADALEKAAEAPTPQTEAPDDPRS